MNPEETLKNSKRKSRRRFLKGGAALAALTAAGAASGQLNIGQDQRTEYIPEDQVPKNAVLRDPWTGEMMRDEEGNLIVDWTGTPQWEAVPAECPVLWRAIRYGCKGGLAPLRSAFAICDHVSPRRRWRVGFRLLGHTHRPQDSKTYFFSLCLRWMRNSGSSRRAGFISPTSTAKCRRSIRGNTA